MSNQKLKKKSKDSTTLKQKIAFKAMVENGGSAGSALRAAGYSKAIVNNPQRVTKSKGFSAMLDKAGLSDTYLARKHAMLMRASRLDEKSFPGLKKGRKWSYPTDAEIKTALEGTEEEPTGCKVVYIKSDAYNKARIAVFRHPDNTAQSKALDLAYDVKGYFAAQKIDLGVDHEMTEEEKKKFNEIMSGNVS